MAPYETLYGRKCWNLLCFIKLGESSNRQKSYADLKRKDIEYSVGDQVLLKESLWRKVLRLGRKGKLSPRFIGPYRILRRISPVAYQLELPLELDWTHDISMFPCWHVTVPTLPTLLKIKEIEVRLNLSFEEESLQILERDVKVLRRKRISLVKVL